MGQQVNPFGFRLRVNKNWTSRWFAGSSKTYIANLLEDQKIRKLLSKRLVSSGLAAIDIERSFGSVKITVKVARPGVVIGRSGSGVDALRKSLEALSTSKVMLNVEEVKNPETSAAIAASEIARQLERRMVTKRVMSVTSEKALSRGAAGVKIVCKGRVGGAKIARSISMLKGTVPLQTLRADIDYGMATANLKDYGTVGIKVWIYKKA